VKDGSGILFSWIQLFKLMDSSYHSSWFEKNQVKKKDIADSLTPDFGKGRV